MNYVFKMIDFSYGTVPKDKITYEYGVDYDSLSDSEKSLFQIAWWGWTPTEIQIIIDKSSALQGTQIFKYQVEGSDLIIIIDKDDVSFYDWHSKQEEPDIVWPIPTFIDFMKQFKKFVEKNS